MRMHVEHVISGKFNKIELSAITGAGVNNTLDILERFFGDLVVDGCPLRASNYHMVNMDEIVKGTSSSRSLSDYFEFLNGKGVLWRTLRDIPDNIRDSVFIYRTVLVSAEHLLRESMEMSGKKTLGIILYNGDAHWLTLKRAMMIIKISEEYSVNPNVEDQFSIISHFLKDYNLGEKLSLFKKIESISGDKMSTRVLESIGTQEGGDTSASADSVMDLIKAYEKNGMPLSQCKMLSRRILRLPRSGLESLIDSNVFFLNYVDPPFRNWMLEALADNLSYFCENRNWARPYNAERMVRDMLGSGKDSKEVICGKLKKGVETTKLLMACSLYDDAESADTQPTI